MLPPAPAVNWISVKPPPQSAASSCGAASSGISASIGITAISCASSTEKVARPPSVRVRPFSPRVCITIAVEDSAKIRPIASATVQYCPNISAAPVIRSAVTPICSPPSPSRRTRIAQSARGSISSPIRNSIITTPNSA